MISHRLASAKMAEKILVLDDGKIVQTGNHEALMEQEGLLPQHVSGAELLVCKRTGR